MNRWFGVIVVALLSIGPLARPSAAVPVLSPASHDFGKSEVGLTRPMVDAFAGSGLASKKTFRVTLDAGDGDLGAVQISITSNLTTGASAPDFSVDPNCISPRPAARLCDADVYFLPLSPGPKSATLIVRINGQMVVSAALSGVGVVAGKYSGKIAYQHTIVGSHGRDNYSVDIGVVGERAFCKGTNVDVTEGGTETTSLDGPGLFELRWNDDTTYEFQFACPNPSQNQPKAEWSEAITSYKQELKADKKTGQTDKKTLAGQWSEPAPETDEVNGVTGTIQMTWELKGRP